MRSCPECSRPLFVKSWPYICQCGSAVTGDQSGDVPFFSGTLSEAYPLREIARESTRERGRKAWESLHAMQFPSAEKIEKWLDAEVPGFDCACKQFAREYIQNNPPPLGRSRREWFEWTWKFHDAVDQKTGDERMSLEDARKYWSERRRQSAEKSFVWNTRQPVEHMLTWDELTRDTAELASIILNRHPDVAAIAGVPRSGMRAACDVAVRLGVPLYEASTENGLRYMGGGSRVRMPGIHGERTKFDGEIVIVDDSICSGFSLRELRDSNPELAKLPVYVVYAATPGIKDVDGYAVHKELPHWFEWNLLGNGQILRDFNVGIDFDGVLCPDCTVECDDDGECYRNWLDTVPPIRTPRAYPVPYIITARLEKYRQKTMDWLAKHRISYGKLVMFPGTFSDRMQTCIGSWKAEKCTENGVKLFIESSYEQSAVIAQKTGNSVISIERRP